MNLNQLRSQGSGVSRGFGEEGESQAPWESSAWEFTDVGTMRCQLTALTPIPSSEMCLFPDKFVRVHRMVVSGRPAGRGVDPEPRLNEWVSG